MKNMWLEGDQRIGGGEEYFLKELLEKEYRENHEWIYCEKGLHAQVVCYPFWVLPATHLKITLHVPTKWQNPHVQKAQQNDESGWWSYSLCSKNWGASVKGSGRLPKKEVLTKRDGWTKEKFTFKEAKLLTAQPSAQIAVISTVQLLMGG